MGVDHLPPAIDLVVGTAERTAMAATFEAERAELEARIENAIALARAPEPAPGRRRQRRPSLASTIKQAKRGGADRVEVDPRTGRFVIPLTGNDAAEAGEGDTDGENPWDEVLPGGANAARKSS
jgi:hypothetical protein